MEMLADRKCWECQFQDKSYEPHPPLEKLFYFDIPKSKPFSLVNTVITAIAKHAGNMPEWKNKHQFPCENQWDCLFHFVMESRWPLVGGALLLLCNYFFLSIVYSKTVRFGKSNRWEKRKPLPNCLSWNLGTSEDPECSAPGQTGNGVLVYPIFSTSSAQAGSWDRKWGKLTKSSNPNTFPSPKRSFHNKTP